MSNTKYCLSWDSYKNNVCYGFAQLQQREEFVDMTLVAEGHLVKVHKNLISLASPYIKHVIKSTPCEHPVIFLINMTHDILCYILEYIYTGEIHVEHDKLEAFVKAAKELQLPGIGLSFPKNLDNQQNACTQESLPKEKEIQILENRVLDYGINNIVLDVNQSTVTEALPIWNKLENRLLDDETIVADNNTNTRDALTLNSEVAELNYSIDVKDYLPDAENFNDFLKFPNTQNSMVSENGMRSQHVDEIGNTKEKSHEISLQLDTNISVPQLYTISTKGSIQLILNRYLYSMQYSACSGLKRRWRCIDYRLLHCQAYIDTLNDKITKRKNSHIHPFHDYKIMNKIKAKLIYGSLSTAVQETTKLKNKLEDVEMIESE